jgi:crotonobetainyl-CoA:carnitine CoA-transferase CaiB-like acyl-CoA transferase
MALAVEADEQWQRLAAEVGDADLDASWDGQQRKANESLIDERISAWTGGQPRDALASRLQALGIPAAPTMHARDVFEDEHLRSRGIWATVQHGRMGEVSVLGMPWLLNGARLPMRAAPLLGVDTSSLLGSRTDVSPQELEAMVDCLPPHSRAQDGTHEK